VHGSWQLNELEQMQNLLTSRLRLRPLIMDDAEFILELVTDPDWLTYIGDKGVHSMDDAKRYISVGPQAMYQQHGLGLLLVESIESCKPLGLCGLLKRDNLPMPDVGFAFLAAARGQGNAYEAASAVIVHSFQQRSIDCLAAITSKTNVRSQALLQKLGFTFKGLHHMDENDPGSNLFELSKATWLKTASVK
jgi:ribosomal-protein-alanine N-acetyltransferase